MAKLIAVLPLLGVIGFSHPAYSQSICFRPSNVSVEQWNVMTADVQAMVCRSSPDDGQARAAACRPLVGSAYYTCMHPEQQGGVASTVIGGGSTPPGAAPPKAPTASLRRIGTGT